MNHKIFLLIIVLVSLANLQVEAQKKPEEMSWKDVVFKQPDNWYATEEALAVAENVLLYQREVGGWPKNTPMHQTLSTEEKENLMKLKKSDEDVTIDNGAIYLEMIYLSKVYNKSKNEKYKTAFQTGLNYLFDAQYENGGWPQFYPLKKGYYTHITFNDNAIINVLQLMKEIYSGNPQYAFINDKATLEKTGKALKKGIECIIKTQYLQNGVLTAWCAQHDEVTLQPAKARAYELPSLSGSESAGIVDFLMEIENPSPEIINSVKAAVKWFEKVKITGIRIEEFKNAEGKKDRIVVADNTAPAMWARFYELENNRPFFCDRDGIKKYALSEIGYERRNGYSWYSDSPQKILDKYPQWEKKWNSTK